jgi:hypothetical protein
VSIRAAAAAAAIIVMSAVASAQQTGQRGAESSRKRQSDRLTTFQVAAGSVLQARLKTPLDSASARVDDQVDAELAGPVSQNGTELIPAGSPIIGKVLDVTRATPRQPLGRVAIAFYVIEHPGTGSRAAIDTHAVVLQAMPVAEEGRDRRKKTPVDVRSSPLQLLTVKLAEPLVVYIPK